VVSPATGHWRTWPWTLCKIIDIPKLSVHDYKMTTQSHTRSNKILVTSLAIFGTSVRFYTGLQCITTNYAQVQLVFRL